MTLNLDKLKLAELKSRLPRKPTYMRVPGRSQKILRLLPKTSKLPLKNHLLHRLCWEKNNVSVVTLGTFARNNACFVD